MEYEEVKKTVEVPRNAGVEGFLHALSEILKMPRVQSVTINAQGQVTYRRYVTQEEESNLHVDFEHVQPYHVIRNAPMEEHFYPPGMAASTVLAGMLDKICSKGMTPIAFVIGAQSRLWSWYYGSTGVEVTNKDRLLGYKLSSDRHIPDSTVVVCAGYGNTQALADTRLSLKIDITYKGLLNDDMEIV